ncbi:Pex24p-domain-containing protein [Saccharata proteae CBS 121410]|uniref:Pex24p-domain-containing protein n=1 Tax=Saccharata proteae CBS 121410 TaxID=1314787 RepID=A0A9P4HUB6_9PEZI|nr:Pex24p-domain-containing protein [Saccharata proteae CBS 121410]
MSPSSRSSGAKNGSPTGTGDPSNPPTYAAFSPATLGHYPSVAKQRSTILVHQKSPLLVATPPQVTRALAYSHPFLLPLNKFVGLLSWTTGDPWESFLLVAAFWASTLYGDVIIRWAGPIVVVVALILGMYTRRYSPLSSTGWTGEKGKGHKRGDSEVSTRHHKSLDDIVDTLKLFTSRCNILLDPLIRMTDFLSTQRTATSATTRPALTTLFIRILLVTPLWIILTLPPLHILTTKRAILLFGTIVLSYHSRPARVSRAILWRSKLVRRILATITGLDFGEPSFTGSDKKKPPPLPPRPKKDANTIAAALAAKRGRGPETPGVRFTFIVYENQRRWLGLGWTSSLLAYERTAWTDEHLNPAPDKDHFELPEVEGGQARWRWAAGSEWRVEGAEGAEGNEADAKNDRGWIYYDNKWRDGRRGQDGWGRYTRRRKWYRDAELVEITPSTEITPSPTPKPPMDESTTFSEADTVRPEGTPTPSEHSVSTRADSISNEDRIRRRRWFGRRPSRAASEKSVSERSNAESGSEALEVELRSDEEDLHTPLRYHERESEWGLGEEARMGLG